MLKSRVYTLFGDKQGLFASRWNLIWMPGAGKQNVGQRNREQKRVIKRE